MGLSRKLTEEEEQLRAELVKLEGRIQAKILWIMLNFQQLPYERMAAGRSLKNTCLLAISYLDDGNQTGLNECLRYLREKGIKI